MHLIKSQAQDSNVFNKISSSIFLGHFIKSQVQYFLGHIIKSQSITQHIISTYPIFYDEYAKISVISRKKLTIYIITTLFFIHPCLPKFKFYKNSATLYKVSSYNSIHHFYIPHFLPAIY